MAARVAAALAVAVAATVGADGGTLLAQGAGSASGQQVYKPGAGVSNPVLLRSVSPKYTPDAMREKIEGVVGLEAVVLANGTVGDVRVTSSLDATFGLDNQAVAAAKQWLFRPGTYNGEVVPVMVALQMEFRIHRGPGGTVVPASAPVVASGTTPAAPAAGSAQAAIVEDKFFEGAYSSHTPGLIGPKATSRSEPTYTREAMQAKIQGTVELDVIVFADGSVGRARVAKSLDDRLGLDGAALAAVNRWRFEPGVLNGKPVPVAVKILFEFKLH